jgi:hypothetical protein
LLKPYAEVEDIQQVLHLLQSHIEPGDAVYVYPGAVFAVDYYVKERDPRFMYGDYHEKAPEKYVPELLAGLDTRAKRFWIVFSHIKHNEDQRIFHDLSKDWNVDPVLTVIGSALYLATRRPLATDTVLPKSSNPAIEASNGTPPIDHTHDSWWDWNIRNSRYPAQ